MNWGQGHSVRKFCFTWSVMSSDIDQMWCLWEQKIQNFTHMSVTVNLNGCTICNIRYKSHARLAHWQRRYWRCRPKGIHIFTVNSIWWFHCRVYVNYAYSAKVLRYAKPVLGKPKRTQQTLLHLAKNDAVCKADPSTQACLSTAHRYIRR